MNISPLFTTSITDIFSALQQYIDTTLPTIIIGDFNVDINTNTGSVMKQIFDENGFKFRLGLDQYSTDNSQIDLLFSNFELFDSFYYESIDTLHKPIIFFL